jgi:hypothetical protein
MVLGGQVPRCFVCPVACEDTGLATCTGAAFRVCAFPRCSNPRGADAQSFQKGPADSRPASLHHGRQNKHNWGHRQVQRRRPDLRVIVSSATLEVERLFNFFDPAGGSGGGPGAAWRGAGAGEWRPGEISRAPAVLSIEGRTHPVQVRSGKARAGRFRLSGLPWGLRSRCARLGARRVLICNCCIAAGGRT